MSILQAVNSKSSEAGNVSVVALPWKDDPRLAYHFKDRDRLITHMLLGRDGRKRAMISVLDGVPRIWISQGETSYRRLYLQLLHLFVEDLSDVRSFDVDHSVSRAGVHPATFIAMFLVVPSVNKAWGAKVEVLSARRQRDSGETGKIWLLNFGQIAKVLSVPPPVQKLRAKAGQDWSGWSRSLALALSGAGVWIALEGESTDRNLLKLTTDIEGWIGAALLGDLQRRS